MSFSMPAFDTHHYVKFLEYAGFNPKQAEAQVKFQAEILDSAVENKMVTKEFFKDSIVALEFKITEVKAELKAEIAKVKRDAHLMKWMLGFISSSMIAVLVKLFLP